MPDDLRHTLWLIYSQLKDIESESDPIRRSELLQQSRQELGEVINQLNRQTEPALFEIFATAGARGGAARTAVKAAASRSNGMKGGRPANTYFCRDCAPLKDDPDNQRLIDCSDSTYAKRKTCSQCGEAVTYKLE